MCGEHGKMAVKAFFPRTAPSPQRCLRVAGGAKADTQAGCATSRAGGEAAPAVGRLWGRSRRPGAAGARESAVSPESETMGHRRRRVQRAPGTADSRAVSAAPANGRHDFPKTRVSSRSPSLRASVPGCRTQVSSAMAYQCSPLLFAPGRLER